MRTRIAAPVLVGALATAVLAVPASAEAATAKPVVTRASVTSLNIGLTGQETYSVRISAYDAKGVRSIKAVPYPLAFAKYAPTQADMAKEPNLLHVLSAGRTTLTVGLTETFDAKTDRLPDVLAGGWGVAILVTGKDGGTTFLQRGTTYSWKRADVLTAKPGATTLGKGATLTLKGTLNRADWDKGVWSGNGGQWVKVQFRPAGTATWVTEGWVRTAADGSVAASARDYRTGSWRLVYTGNAVSGAANSAAASVTVK